MKSLKSKQLPVTLRKTNTYQADTDEPAVSIHVQRHKQLQCIQIRGPGSDMMHLLENKHLPFTPQPPKIPTHTQKSICYAHREEQAKVLYPHPQKNQSPCTHTRTSSYKLKERVHSNNHSQKSKGNIQTFPLYNCMD